ncbi:hypothetical protein [Thermincola ferriacetica]
MLQRAGIISKKFGWHLIPLLIIFMEYLSVSAALKIAETMGDYTTISLLQGLIRIGDNVSYHSVPMILVVMHVASLVLGIVYFYVVTLHGLGREAVETAKDRVPIWNLDDWDNGGN